MGCKEIQAPTKTTKKRGLVSVLKDTIRGVLQEETHDFFGGSFILGNLLFGTVGSKSNIIWLRSDIIPKKLHVLLCLFDSNLYANMDFMLAFPRSCF